MEEEGLFGYSVFNSSWDMTSLGSTVVERESRLAWQGPIPEVGLFSPGLAEKYLPTSEVPIYSK